MKNCKHPLYNVWKRMLDRCNNPMSDRYQFYGARGIKVCQRWTDFDLFLSDVGPKPFPGASIDRKNGNGNYCPENCRWASQTEQARNTRNNTLLTFDGKTMCIAEWSEELGVPAPRISARKKLGWSDEDALSKPRDEIILEFKGQRKGMRIWAKEIGIGYRTIWYRLSKGWSIEKALTHHVRHHITQRGSKLL